MEVEPISEWNNMIEDSEAYQDVQLNAFIRALRLYEDLETPITLSEFILVGLCIVDQRSKYFSLLDINIQRLLPTLACR